MENAPMIIRKNEVSHILSGKWEELVTLMENAFESYSNGQVIQPVRLTMKVDKYDECMLLMPGFHKVSGSLATKIVTIYLRNKEKNLPIVNEIILLYNVSNGVLKAIMDAKVITEMRTAAASMVATKYLAPKDVKYMAILGSGAQARSHYQVMKHFYKFEMIFVWNINKASGDKFVKEIAADGQKCMLSSTVQEAVKTADIINVVTRTTKPIIRKEWVKEGAHINAVGAGIPDWQELEENLVLSAVVYVDSKEGAFSESGDIIKSGTSIYSEIGEVVSGKKQALFNKTTIFKSLGMAVQDVVTAEMVFKTYCQQKNKCEYCVGTTLCNTHLKNKL